MPRFTPEQKVWIRRIARESSAGAGTMMGVGLGLGLIYQRVDIWIVGFIVLGLAMSLFGFMLIPLYLDEEDD